MDHHHSWRPLPPAGNNTNTICPICSISHFPFCPPPPSPFIQNPRFHLPQPNYFHPPFHPNHHTSSSSINHNNNNNNYPIDIRPPPPANPTFHPTTYHNNNIHPTTRRPYYYDHNNNNNNNKRMKIEPRDNERILKLIHDHGHVDNINFGFKPPNSSFDRRQEPYSYGNNHFHYQPPPLPASPPKNPSLFPLPATSSSSPSAAAPRYYYYNATPHPEEFHIPQSSSEKPIQPYPLRPLSSEKQNIIDAARIFKQPHRASRPDHLVIILRGLPGSGKSYLAKLLRDIEVENGGEAPRIHSMDVYFMIEVQKAEESELSKSSGSLRSKRHAMKTVMEYCYEPEMEEAYRASMLKAFKKTLDEGVYSFIIVDDRNLRVADFAQFWATAKRSGYEVYLVEASYKDPAGCAARNVHNFTLPDIQKMAGQWEEAPSLYLKMDIKSLLHGDGLVETDIQEVDMDMEDEDAIDASQDSNVRKPHDDTKDQADDFRPHDEAKVVTVTNHQIEEVKDLSRSKWSNNFDAEEEKNSGGALSGLVQAYSSKEAKSVSWGDQGGNVGFLISATRKTNTRSLVIGPGPGYNLKSNPLAEEEYIKPAQIAIEPSIQSLFQEQIRAERQSFKAVFDKRRQRIGGFNIDDE